MAILNELGAEWDEWVSTRPEVVQKLCRKLPPNRLYRLKTSGNRCTLYAYHEDGTLTVIVDGEFNAVAFSRRVFGIKPEDLEECELPSPDEPVGAMLVDPKDIQAYCDYIREMRSKPQTQANAA